MKTSDIFKINRDSRRLNESMERLFGTKLNLESFDLPQLQDARNKIRTQLSQVRTEGGFNENVENEAFTQAQFMLDAINSEIAQRQEFIADAGTAEIEEAAQGLSQETADKILSQDYDLYDILSGRTDVPKEDVDYLQTMYDDVSVDHGLHADDNFEEIFDIMYSQIESDYGDWDSDEGGETDDNYALASAGFGSDEDYESVQYESKQGENMRKVTEGEIQQASAIVTAKTMVDRVGRWIEELSGMENDTLLQLGDSIRDEMSQEQAKQFISTCAPAIQAALENLKTTRETLASGVRQLTGEEQGAEMLGSEPEGDMGDELGDLGGEAEPDMMNAGDEEVGPPEDEFGASDAGAGGLEAAGRAKRESIDRSNQLLRVLAG